MVWRAIRGNTLKTRISIVAVALFLVSIWSLSLYVSRALGQDLQRLLGEQQYSTVQLVAAEINQQLSDRQQALQAYAVQINEELLRHPDALQKFLEDKRVVQLMFSAGLYATAMDGTAIASVPAALGRKGTNFRERGHLVAALEQGQTTISDPVVGKFLKVPVVSISTPLRDARGRVIGALVGVINLQEPNFLDRIVDHPYGKTGGYLIVDSDHSKYVTATDKRLVGQPLPGADQSDAEEPLPDGYGLSQNAQNVALLSASSHIPVANWHVLVQLPVAEAFSPIQALEWRIFAAAAVLSVLAGSLLWWMLGAHLRPLAQTAGELNALTALDTLPEALPVPAVTETAQLVMAFNHLLSHVHRREMVLQQSEQRYRAMTEGAPLAMCVVREGLVVYLNPAAAAMFGAASVQDLLGRAAIGFVHPAFRELTLEHAQAPVAEQLLKPLSEQIYLRLDGTPFEVEVHSCPIMFDGNSAVHVTMRDLSAQRRHEEHLRKLSRITEQAPMAIAIANLTGAIEYTNPWFSVITGYSAEEMLGRNPRFLQSGQTPPQVYEDLWRTLLERKVWQGEFHNRKKNGEVFVESATIAPVLDSAGNVTHYVALKQDVTLRKQTEAALQHSLNDKVALLHEVHHRVKNNLQVVTSMLRLEAARSAQGETRSVLRDMQSRIRSMALLHETLYRSGSFAAIDLGAYLRQLANQAFRAHDLSNQAVRLVCELQSVPVDMDLATPCGLLVNELLTNSLKHGFPQSRSGRILVQLQPAAAHDSGPLLPGNTGPSSRWHLRVSDDGIGLPADWSTRGQHSLGLQLVADLVQQLQGRLLVEPGPGAGFSVFFSIQDQKAS